MRAEAALVARRRREDVAEMFHLSLKAVDAWWAKWKASRRDALATRPRGERVGEQQVLPEAEQAVGQAILDQRPRVLGLVGLVGQPRTRGQAGALIAKLYRARLTEPKVGSCPRRWELSFQRPDTRAMEQNPQAMRIRHEENWPRSGPRRRPRGLLGDQAGIRSDQVTGRSLPMPGRARDQAHSPTKPAGSSNAANASRTTSAAASTAGASATPSNRTHPAASCIHCITNVPRLAMLARSDSVLGKLRACPALRPRLSRTWQRGRSWGRQPHWQPVRDR